MQSNVLFVVIATGTLHPLRYRAASLRYPPYKRSREMCAHPGYGCAARSRSPRLRWQSAQRWSPRGTPAVAADLTVVPATDTQGPAHSRCSAAQQRRSRFPRAKSINQNRAVPDPGIRCAAPHLETFVGALKVLPPWLSDLLVKLHADQQCERVLGEQLVSGVIVSQMQFWHVSVTPISDPARSRAMSRRRCSGDGQVGSPG